MLKSTIENNMILTICLNPSINTYTYLPVLELGKSNRFQPIQEFPGRQGEHVALVIRELGGERSLKGLWAGSSGEWIINSCRKFWLEPTEPEIQGNTYKCFTFLTEQQPSDHTEILESGPSLQEDDFILFKKGFMFSLESADFVCNSESWPKGSLTDACAQLFKIANESGIKVFLDCIGVQLKNSLAQNVFGLHLNEFEYEEVVRELGKEVFDRISCLAVTKRKESLILKYFGEQVKGNLELDRVISTVGCGDCLTAGICLAISKNLSIREITWYGVACGAANCLREELGMIDKSDFEKSLLEVELDE